MLDTEIIVIVSNEVRDKSAKQICQAQMWDEPLAKSVEWVWMQICRAASIACKTRIPEVTCKMRPIPRVKSVERVWVQICRAASTACKTRIPGIVCKTRFAGESTSCVMSDEFKDES